MKTAQQKTQNTQSQSVVEDHEDAGPFNEDGEEGYPTSVDVEDSDNENDEEETVSVEGVLSQVGNKRKRDYEPIHNGDTIAMGQETTIAGLEWKRIPDLLEDVRTEPHLPTTFRTNLFNDATRVCDVFEALLPLSKDVQLQIVRENSEELNDGLALRQLGRGGIVF